MAKVMATEGPTVTATNVPIKPAATVEASDRRRTISIIFTRTPCPLDGEQPTQPQSKLEQRTEGMHKCQRRETAHLHWNRAANPGSIQVPEADSWPTLYTCIRYNHSRYTKAEVLSTTFWCIAQTLPRNKFNGIISRFGPEESHGMGTNGSVSSCSSGVLQHQAICS